MDWKRIARHLWIGGLHVRRILPAESLERITQAVARAESGHHGEIRFAVEASLDLGPLLKGMTARERAVEVFAAMRVWDTEANNGVLIYLLLADHDVEILGDRGIHAKVGVEGWEGICRKMEAEFRKGAFESGIIAGVAEVGRMLAAHFPNRGPDVNELPDGPMVL